MLALLAQMQMRRAELAYISWPFDLSTKIHEYNINDIIYSNKFMITGCVLFCKFCVR